MRRRLWILAAVPAVAATAALVPSTISSARPAVPTLRMLAVLHDAQAQRFGKDPGLSLSLGVYLAAVNGPFELQARRTPTGLEVVQVVRAGDRVTVVRQLPADPATNFSYGLGNFLHLTLTDSSGATVAQHDLPFCPNSFEPSRVDDSGPLNPTYPWFCGARLSRAMTWGIDRGWAVPVSHGFAPAPGVPDGTYTLTIAVNDKWANALQMSERSATVQLTVTTSSRRCPPTFCRPGLLSGAPIASSAAASAAMAGGVTTAPRPDLIPLPARDVSVAHIRRVNVDLLAFAATVWNAGPGPLLVEGFRPGDPPFMPATQYFVSDGSIVGQARAGDFHYDNRPTHKHWHFEDFATYQLVNRVTGHTVVSGKQSFCLAPTDAVDLTAPGSEFRPDEIGLGSICGDISSIWLREMLPVGWGDTYVQSRAGQAFNITGVPNGDYDIRVVTNPDQRLYESDYTNNVSTLHVRLGGSRGDRTVAVVS